MPATVRLPSLSLRPGKPDTTYELEAERQFAVRVNDSNALGITHSNRVNWNYKVNLSGCRVAGVSRRD